MPQAGPHRTSSIFLADTQAAYFSRPSPTGQVITDNRGVCRPVVQGEMNAEEEHYGVFEGSSLIASLTLSSPTLLNSNCPTLYWSIGLIEVTNRFQGLGIGPKLLDAVFDIRSQPLASDLDQDGGGADMWRRWIRNHPGQVELFDATGSLGVVVNSNGTYIPDPWACRNTRLVRKP